MRRSTATLLAAAISVGLIPGVPLAQTLEEALVDAYALNPTLNAERARQRATDEQVPQALSGYRPTVSTSVQAGGRWLDSNEASVSGQQDDAVFTRSYGASIEQPLYSGGQTVAAVRGAENAVLSGRAQLESVEQTVLLNAATAYSDVYRDQAVVELNVRNEQRLARQLEATSDRFQVGEVTRTDVSQAEARLARAVAERISAEGNLARSRAVFRNVVGRMPEKLPRPPLPEGLPASLEESNGIALDWNPDVTAAEFSERSALDGVDQVKGELLPSVSLIGRVQRDMDVSRSDSRFDTAEALVSLQVPLYQAGAVYSRLRERKQVVIQQRRRLNQTQNDAVEGSTRAWNALETAVAAIGSLQKQVQANQLALEGVEKEAEVGARTVLDVLDAEQELLDSEVSLVSAERDEVVASYQLKSAVGQLTARRLGLPIEPYSPEQHYREVRGAWFGGSSSGDSSGDFAPPSGRR